MNAMLLIYVLISVLIAIASKLPWTVGLEKKEFEGSGSCEGEDEGDCQHAGAQGSPYSPRPLPCLSDDEDCGDGDASGDGEEVSAPRGQSGGVLGPSSAEEMGASSRKERPMKTLRLDDFVLIYARTDPPPVSPGSHAMRGREEGRRGKGRERDKGERGVQGSASRSQQGSKNGLGVEITNHQNMMTTKKSWRERENEGGYTRDDRGGAVAKAGGKGADIRSDGAETKVGVNMKQHQDRPRGDSRLSFGDDRLDDGFLGTGLTSKLTIKKENNITDATQRTPSGSAVGEGAAESGLIASRAEPEGLGTGDSTAARDLSLVGRYRTTLSPLKFSGVNSAHTSSRDRTVLTTSFASDDRVVSTPSRPSSGDATLVVVPRGDAPSQRRDGAGRSLQAQQGKDKDRHRDKDRDVIVAQQDESASHRTASPGLVSTMGMNIGLIVGIAAAILVLLLVLACLIYKRRRDSGREQGSYKLDTTDNLAFDPSSGGRGAGAPRRTGGTQGAPKGADSTPPYSVPGAAPCKTKKKHVREWYV